MGHPRLVTVSESIEVVCSHRALQRRKKKIQCPGHPPGAAHICDTPCVERDPYYIGQGEFIDGQSVLSGQNYSILRRWSVDGIAAGVLDQNNVAWDFEILHVSNDNEPYFTIEYGNDPKAPN